MQVKFILLMTLAQIVNIQIYNVYCSSNDSIQRRLEDNNENHHLQLSSNRSLFFSNTDEIVANDEDTKVIAPLPTKNVIVPKKSIKLVSKLASSKFQHKYSKNMKKLAHNGAKLVKVSVNSLWESVISIFNIIQATFDFAAKKMILFFDHPKDIMSLPYDAFKIMKTNINFPFQFFKYLY